MLPKFILVLAIAAAAALGHMELVAPCPRYSSKCATKPALPTGKIIDYDLNSAIGSNGRSWNPYASIPRRGPKPQRHGPLVLRYCFYTAAPKAGGVDAVRAYTFTLPAGLPGTSNAIFAWTWVNAVGNREFYNNCGEFLSRAHLDHTLERK
ncbi:hypothetical protein BX661DRAFT_169026 [Kickxella alabastrina]|uniref:uncharacterized protein n=1 Tax=Kickxella alabastrina TaxID=61397 RepID=UPI00221E6528|nr:uncharacterized protein BX661DRAFT_169026 [Kickxella alabastrina]KAI7833922.1 hypothetical protein BX661DRAFT_169026 [Kickxella alabastrina]